MFGYWSTHFGFYCAANHVGHGIAPSGGSRNIPEDEPTAFKMTLQNHSQGRSTTFPLFLHKFFFSMSGFEQAAGECIYCWAICAVIQSTRGQLNFMLSIFDYANLRICIQLRLCSGFLSFLKLMRTSNCRYWFWQP